MVRVRRIMTSLVSGGIIALVGDAAHATVVRYDNSVEFFRDISPASQIRKESWDGFAPSTVLNNGDAFNGVTYNASTGFSKVVNTGQSLSPPNNLFYGGGFSPLASTRTFGFASPVDFFGIFVVSTFAIQDGQFFARTDRGETIPSVYNPFFPGHLANFIGFKSDRLVSSVEIGANVNAGYGLDDMYFGRFDDAGSPVPAPAALPLAMTALLMFGGLLFLRRRSNTS